MLQQVIQENHSLEFKVTDNTTGLKRAYQMIAVIGNTLFSLNDNVTKVSIF